jgi:dimethylglycine dehydrogenase
VFGVVNGWERSNFYKPTADFVESHGYALQNWHDVVGAEIEALAKNVGLAELSGFNHYRISGSGALDWLSSLTCSPVSAKTGKASLCYFLTVSAKTGKASLCYFLTHNGNIAGEATIVPLPAGDIFYGSAATAEYHDMDWLSERLPRGSDIRIESYTNTHTMLLIAGPRARDLLATVSPRTNWGQSDFPWLSAQSCFIGHVEALAIAISYSGEQAALRRLCSSQQDGSSLRPDPFRHVCHRFDAHGKGLWPLERRFHHRVQPARGRPESLCRHEQGFSRQSGSASSSIQRKS